MRHFKKGSDTWDVSVADADLLIVETRGGERRFDTKTCKNAAQAKRQADDLILGILKEGFTEIDGKGKGKKSATKRRGDGRRWQGSCDDRRRILVLDQELMVMGRSRDLKCYGFGSPNKAEDYALAVLENWRADGFEISGPETIPRASIPSTDNPRPPPKLRPPFSDLADVSPDEASIDLDYSEEGEGPASDRVRRLFHRVAGVGSRRVRISIDGCPRDEDWFESVLLGAKLPAVTSFAAEGPKYMPVEFGDLGRVLEACPNVRRVSVRGSTHVDSFASDTLEFLRLGVLEAAAFEGLLTGTAPNLVEVIVDTDELEYCLGPIAEEGLPKSWRVLRVSPSEVADLDSAVAMLASSSTSLARLDRFELRIDFGVDVEEARARLQAVCPGIDYDGPNG